MIRLVCAVIVIAACILLAAKGDISSALIIAASYAAGFVCGVGSAHHDLGLL